MNAVALTVVLLACAAAIFYGLKTERLNRTDAADASPAHRLAGQLIWLSGAVVAVVVISAASWSALR